MRDPNRIEPMLQLIREVWYKTPDLRLTQLIMNALRSNQDPYYVEDERLKEALEDCSRAIPYWWDERGL